jgi:hypothetical protein
MPEKVADLALFYGTTQPNICSFIAVVTDPQHLYLVSNGHYGSIVAVAAVSANHAGGEQVLEYVSGGDLLDYILKKARNPGPGLRKL